MVLYPFKNERTQRLVSGISLLLAVILMINASIYSIYGFNINSFAVGLIIGFVGLLYLFDL